MIILAASPRTHRRHVITSLAMAAVLTLSTVIAAPARAELIHTPGGPATLSLAGLKVDLPPVPGREYRISGSWALSADGGFDGRDVIDVATADSVLVEGNWVSLGYFTAGEPDSVVAAIDMVDTWSSHLDLQGQTWAVRGGTFDLGGSLGPVQTAVACAPLGGGMSLLFHHYFLDQTAMTQAAMLEGLQQCGVLKAVWSAIAQHAYTVAAPTLRPEIRNRGDVPAARTVTLTGNELEIALPDDGSVWITRYDADAGVDYLDRMSPSLPDVSLEVMWITGMDVAQVFAAIEMPKLDPAPLDLPEGWQATPRLSLGDRVETTASLETPNGVAIVGVLQAEGNVDVAPLRGVIEAIGASVRSQESGN